MSAQQTPSKRVPYSRVLPELNRFDSVAERRRGYRDATWATRRDWRVWVWFLFYYVILIGFIVLLLVPSLRATRISPGVLGGIIGGLVGGASTVILNVVFRQPIRRRLRERLVELGVPICVACGYDLRGQTEPRCSECGAEFDPNLISTSSDADSE